MIKSKAQTPHDFGKITDELVTRLNEHGLEAYVWSKATTGSCYIRFKDPRMCSIRIADHNNIEKFKYKYNLRSDIKSFSFKKEDNIWRMFYPLTHVNKLVKDILERRDHISKWNRTAQHQYGIPYHILNKQKSKTSHEL